jgi:hypothetical protein
MIWKNIVEPDRPQMKIWRMRIACWVPKATNTNLEYVLLIALSLQQWLHERASMLRYTYIVPFYTTGSYDCNQSFALILKYLLFSFYTFNVSNLCTIYPCWWPLFWPTFTRVHHTHNINLAQHAYVHCLEPLLCGCIYIYIYIYIRFIHKSLIINTTLNFKYLLWWLLWNCSVISVRTDSWISSVPHYISEQLRKPQITFRMLKSYMTLCYLKLT